MIAVVDRADAARLLLAGPRGRALCLAVSGVDVLDVISSTYLAENQQGPAVNTDDRAAAWPLLTAATPAAVARAVAEQPPVPDERLDEAFLLEALADVVSGAAYWQPPDDEEVVAADPVVVAALVPVAAAVADTVLGASWWDRRSVLDDQHYVSWIDDRWTTRAAPPPLTGVAQRLAAWRRDAQQPDTLWWSTPNRWDVVSTSPSFGSLPALQLALVEDPQGLIRARVTRLRPEPEVRVHEITEPEAWVGLVESYPLDVGASRGQEWRNLTGRRGPWLMPDWSGVACAYDAVHLTVLAYLATAGRALDVAGGTTVLAGWEPDVTFWLTDTLTQAEDFTTWTASDPTGGYTAWRRG